MLTLSGLPGSLSGADIMGEREPGGRWGEREPGGRCGERLGCGDLRHKTVKY